MFVGTTPLLNLAQPPKNEQREVVVEREYEPIIQQVQRIQLIPEFQDTVTVNLNFTYDIRSSAIYGHFTPRPIQAAILRGEPIYPLDHAYFLIGGGTKLSGLTKLRVNTLRNQNYQGIFAADFQGAKGEVENRWGQNVEATYANTEIVANGKQFFQRATLEGNLQYNNYYRTYYGSAIDPQTIDQSLTSNIDEHQNINQFQTQISLYSFERNISKPNFSTEFKFNHLNSIRDVVEDKFGLRFYIDKYYDINFLGLETRIQYIQNEKLTDTLSNLFIDFNPWIGFFGRTWRIQVGLNSTYNQKTAEYYLYPNVKLHYNIAAFFLVPYVDVGGKFKLNSFEEIVKENFFINPQLAVKPTNEKFNIQSGIRGMVSSRFGFNANASYQIINNQYFFITDTTDILSRFYTVEYDNMTAFSLNGELSWKQSDELNIILRSRYTTYTLDFLPSPWHMPRFTADLTARYRMYNKLTLSTELFALGKRKFKNTDQTIGELKPLIDINLMAEYQVNRIVGFFVKFDNILHREQQYYAHYPLHRFVFQTGAKILF